MRGFLLSAAFVAAFVVAHGAPVFHLDSETRVQGSYIVVLKTSTEASRDKHVRRVQGLAGVGPNVRRFEIGQFAGYSTQMSDDALAVVRNMPEVNYIEADQVVHANQKCTTQSPTPSWGLDRVSERALALTGQYTYGTTGAGVDAYVVDTGIHIAHPDFAGRAVWGANYADTTNDDCNGHGTHVAGTVGGTSFGVAKDVKLIAVKVLNCEGSGTNAGVIEGIQYVAKQAASSKRPSVGNMSLGGSKSSAVNAAVAAVIEAGITFVVAAGNDNKDACSYSPASEASAITVGATDTSTSADNKQTDIRASYSNFGKCVTLFAPGTDITSAWIPPYSEATISGTSMASPHVCGVAARLLSGNTTLTPADIKAHLVVTTTNSTITMNCATTACKASPNKLVYLAC